MLIGMKVLKWLFPIGAFLTVGGVFLYALVERLSFGDTRGWGYSLLSQLLSDTFVWCAIRNRWVFRGKKAPVR
jgi:hypothetical protein